MPLIPLVLIQIMCGIHAVRTGQERYWLYIIIGLPGLGCVIYFLAIVVPDLFASRDGQRLVRHAHDKIDPQRHLRILRDDLSVAETSQNHVRLADELVRLGQFEEAVEHYEKALTSIFLHDPDIMLKLATALFYCNEPERCLQTLDAIMQFNPDFQSQDGHLLYAKALVVKGNLIKAEDEYQVLVGYYTGPEARFNYYQLLRKQGRIVEARQQLEIIANTARRSKPHYRRLHKQWLSKANQEMKTLKNI